MRRDIPLSRLQDLPAGKQGLLPSEIQRRRARYGWNNILETPVNPWFSLVRDTLKDPMIWFLVGTGIVYAVLGSYTESLALLVAILPLVGMDAFLHRRTQASTEGLRRQLARTARVVREGQVTEVMATELVPGDLVRVVTGEAFPADGLIVDGGHLQADESSLTGEAFPVHKHALSALPSSDAGAGAVWVEGESWGWAGSRLLTGQAELRVVFTGGDTLYGQIVQAAVAGQRERTPLQDAIAHLVSFLMVAAGVLCLILAGVRLRQGHDWVDALISAATLAVAALPEEFPVVFTVFLGVGIYRLARSQALVRRGVSVENIGRVSCICSDKTGTLTEGRLRLEHLLPAADTDETDLLFWASLASRGDSGDPMDEAILTRLAGQPERPRPEMLLATYPYTEQRRRETAVLKLNDQLIAVSKGSPEALLELSTLEPSARRHWIELVERFAAQGHKVLGCLHWELQGSWMGGEPDRGGTFAGLLACEDPIRDGVVEAVRQCRDAGIQVIMVTGDHPATAASVARDIGLIDTASDGILLGEDLTAYGGQVDWHRVRVVARALPSQKLDLVNALKARGEIVAVTGDGVNDVPALQAADVGIAMGERGTRSAREVAAIVLLNDNFGAIVHAIAEGRQLFRNLQLSFQYLLMLHIPLVITATFIPLAGYPILYLPIHIVWYETLIHPTALLVFQELAAAGPLQPIRKRQAARFFSAGEWWLIAAVGILLTALVLWTYDRGLAPGRNIEHARAMAMVVLTCASASATAVLSRMRTRGAWWMIALTLGSSLLLVQTPKLAAWLSLQPLHRDDWLIAMAGGILSVAAPVGLFAAGRRIRQAWFALLGSAGSHADTASAPNAVNLSRGEPTSPPLTRYAGWSVLTALLTIVLKAGAYVLTGSVALLSDAAESLVNLVAAAFALVTLHIAARPADESHPFGHGKAEYFSSGFEGAMILVAATGILYAAGTRLLHPQPLQALDLGILISVIASVCNGVMALTLLRVGRRYRSITLEADGQHLMTDVWTTGAIVLGLGGMAITGWAWLDPVIAMVAGLNIVHAGIRLILRSLSGLLDTALPAEERDVIEEILNRYRRQGFEFHDLRARPAGAHRLVTLHALVPGVMTIQEAHDLMERIEGDIREHLPNLLIVTHAEPLDDPASFRHEMLL